MSCGVGSRHSLNLALLWLWYRLEAIALIRPLAWEPPYAAGEALKKKKKKKKPYSSFSPRYAKSNLSLFQSKPFFELLSIPSA